MSTRATEHCLRLIVYYDLGYCNIAFIRAISVHVLFVFDYCLPLANDYQIEIIKVEYIKIGFIKLLLKYD